MSDSGSKLKTLLQPRLLLFVWGGIGFAALLWVLGSSMIPKGKPQHSAVSSVQLEKLTKGAMQDFELAFPPREAPPTYFDGPEAQLSIADMSGRIILVNLWATWCAPCVEEMPALDALQKAAGDESFEVVAIAVGPQPKMPVEQFFAKHDIRHLAIYRDQDLDFAGYMGGLDALPLTVLYDRNGMEIGRITGAADWSSQEAIALIEAAKAQ